MLYNEKNEKCRLKKQKNKKRFQIQCDIDFKKIKKITKELYIQCDCIFYY